jgi:hypothetical protein
MQFFRTSNKKKEQLNKTMIQNANEIVSGLAAIKSELESKYKSQSDLYQRVAALMEDYKRRVETKADVSALDKLSTKTLTYLDALLRDKDLTDPEKVLEIIQFALVVLEKVYKAQSESTRTPDTDIIDGLDLGPVALKSMHEKQIRMQKIYKEEEILDQTKEDYDERLAMLVKANKDYKKDSILVDSSREQSNLATSILEHKKIVNSAFASIPLLVSVFEDVGYLNSHKELADAVKKALQQHADNIEQTQETIAVFDGFAIEERVINELAKNQFEDNYTQAEMQNIEKAQESIGLAKESVDASSKTYTLGNENPLELENKD